MIELSGGTAEGMYCSQAGIPVQAASQPFLDAYRARFKTEPILYAPFTYDATWLLIDAMKQAQSSAPKSYLPLLAKSHHAGATGTIEFRCQG